MSTYEGDFLIAAYNCESIEGNYEKLLATKKQMYFSINKVSKLVINYKFYTTGIYSIVPKRLLQLAKLTAEVFPNYLPESFYSEATGSKGSKQRENEVAIQRIQSQRYKRKSIEEANVESADFKFLKERVNFIDEKYMQKWSVTAVPERDAFHKTADLKTIFETLPNLASPSGYELIQVDFYILFNKEFNIFIYNWTILAKKIIAIAKSKKSDKEIEVILLDNDPFKGEEHERTVALILLPFLFKRTPEITSKSKLKSSWIPEKSDVLESFIFHIKETQNLVDSLKTVYDKLLKIHVDHKFVLRPYIVTCTPTIWEIRSAYVILGVIKYQLLTPTLAVDACFSCMKVRNIPYLSICNHYWQILERKVYKFDVPNVYAGVSKLIECLMKLK